MARVAVKKLVKRFGQVVAVDHITFEAKDKEFLVLLGPSGCGKTTTLRLIAGLETPDDGEIWIGDKLVNELPPKERDVAMVFQSYALYPHMKVYDNIAFPLKIRNLPKKEIDKRVHEIAKLLKIEELLNRYPRQLSGGQQQRVALGRALVREPRVFLMDEPLSNLDAKLRVYMRAELKRLQRELGITTIYVTHDQAEAMTMADKIVIMNEGRIEQIGVPSELYHKPATLFVAGFIGAPAMNFIDASLVYEDSKVLLDSGFFKLELPDFIADMVRKERVSEVVMGIRPEHVHIVEKKEPEAFEVEVYVIEPLGGETIVDFVLGEKIHKIKYLGELDLKPGDKIYIKFDKKYLHIFDKRTGIAYA